jgi:PAS domain S-box-containing protein
MMNSSHAPRDSAYDLPPPGSELAGLEHSEEHYCQLLQSLPAAVYVCDMQGRVKLFNEAAAELWGRRPVIGHDLWCGSLRIYRLDGTPLSLENCPMAATLRERCDVSGYEILIERPDGSRRNVLPFPRIIRDRAGKAVGAVNMLVDITQMKRTESALKDAAETALRSKDRFLAVLSHELRTPLTPVAMAAAAIAGNADLPVALREEVEMIRRNVDLETKLIDDLLDLSRITSGKLRLQPQTLDLNDAVKHISEICKAEILQKRIQLNCDLGADVGKINADPARLRQVFWNVLKNAAKFTPEGGDIFITTERANGHVRITIRDTGIGIAADKLPGIFDAFEQGGSASGRQFGGLGLGLAISKALIELHQGQIRVASDGVGKGATFIIELPEPVKKMEKQNINTDCGASGRPASLRLLLVEDHVDTARMLVKLLGSAGYTVRTACDAAGALELAANEPFDLLVSDIGLPDATGYHLMQQIKRDHGMPGIAMSGYGMDEDIRKSHEAGFSDHLVKPISFAQLDQAIQRLAHG